MAYKRQIAYFDLIEFGEKKRNGGFCKWEQKNIFHSVQITLNGLKDEENRKVNIFTREKKELGEVSIKNGGASLYIEREDKEGIWEWEFSEMHIPLSEGRELVAEFEVDVKRKPEKVESTPEVLQVKRNNGEEGKEKREREIEVLQTEKLPMREMYEGETRSRELRLGEVKVQLDEIRVWGEKTEEKQLKEVPMESIAQSEEQLLEDVPLYSLWDCLTKTHEVIHPFGTEARYCKIGVEEILLLKERYHILRKNQFLLHGYYNYKYLIIGKKDSDSEEYWLGVPGIYHEREKMAARMYGFEKFEGRKTSYRVGDLGFYLITVE